MFKVNKVMYIRYFEFNNTSFILVQAKYSKPDRLYYRANLELELVAAMWRDGVSF